ncbi:DUF1697 domain-containing protein [Janthinobacterium sp. PLB04]|uniref:DUF1697 domain-containing protein n=1 Tax=Janthinobacterium lividum TaxID=29581 RepID=A0AAJ4T587_9BURK|nr:MULTISPECIES: DUF1697 domain-containing protein [Janthinobacterium]KAB0326796.1 DUF1697 domain-containing protein [Janthinobacterium lividum]MDQ4626366.1 DUF1697 domain-containing protein [Janthinobacterium lividum]MDQ4674667.1 DUF1697 domain-containing protein [Janthinobacterium lividum]MDQ4685399.1 DUF1697 domain-containing protein [Janthinobacterium lividum]QSX95927.1 DUF1697 domain-containing protein [Janthinobacterium lividum]
MAQMENSQQVALLRGINVGRAKRVAMADLRKLLGDLGFAQVSTVLNSGNVVYDGGKVAPADAAARIEEALVLKLGVAARVTVLSASQFAELIEQNPLAPAADAARLLVLVLNNPADVQRLAPLLQQPWQPEALALGRWAAYAWCPDGVLASKVVAALGVLLGDGVTSRNWATMQKLHALLNGPEAAATSSLTKEY